MMETPFNSISRSRSVQRIFDRYRQFSITAFDHADRVSARRFLDAPFGPAVLYGNPAADSREKHVGGLWFAPSSTEFRTVSEAASSEVSR